MPREEQGTPAGQQAGMGGQDRQGASAGSQPGGGIGNPINTPDPLSKYKWWILGGLALLLSAAAAFLLRKPATGASCLTAVPARSRRSRTMQHLRLQSGQRSGKTPHLLNVLKEELFALESEKISGTITPEEYAEVKAALETVLKRALKQSKL